LHGTPDSRDELSGKGQPGRRSGPDAVPSTNRIESTEPRTGDIRLVLWRGLYEACNSGWAVAVAERTDSQCAGDEVGRPNRGPVADRRGHTRDAQRLD